MSIFGMGLLEIVVAVIVALVMAGPDRIADAAAHAVRVFIDEVRR